ncbi:hypothetical protein R6Q57_001300 [Mikania cordata]
MADVAGYHGSDGGDEPPHGHDYKMPTSYESSKPSKRRAYGKNLNLYDKFQKNGSRPLPIELISDEVDRHAPFHYRSWQEVLGDVKMSFLTTLHDGIKLGIQDYCANRYKDRKTKLKKHFDKEGGYDNTERAKQNPPKGMDPEAWDNITEELNKAKSTSGGDDTPVDEVEVLERSLGQRRGHVRGVGRTVKKQQRINEMMQQQINKLMSMQGGQSSSSPYYLGFEENQYQDQNQDEDEDDESD